MTAKTAALLGAGLLILLSAALAFLLLKGRAPTTFLGATASIRTAAMEYGAAGTPEACVERALDLGAPCPRLLVGCATRANLFAYWCLDAAGSEAGPQLCAEVPASTDIFGTRDWVKDRCGPKGRDEACGAISSTLQRYCH
ncbi:MAG: hypothetical protein GY898_15985 [Proteobacteria bacterium]|nr:hypothetical protein [Pseudomonadota bacterium]